MPARKPEDLDIMIGQFINAGDVESALALYEPGAAFVVEPGNVVTGKDAIRRVMVDIVAMKPTITIEAKAVESGDIALLYGSWSLSGTDPDGGAVSMTGSSREVARRQPNGDWLFVIDDPNGG
jgi:ketosteroid isomerase-like protein